MTAHFRTAPTTFAELDRILTDLETEARANREWVSLLAARAAQIAHEFGAQRLPEEQEQEQEQEQSPYVALPHPISEYISPCVPDGYDTVLGYLAHTNPEALALLYDPIEDTQRDGFWLTHRAKQEGHTVVKVPSPMVIHARNPEIAWVNAYPVSLLERRLG